jgi:hypothetical protein
MSNTQIGHRYSSSKNFTGSAPRSDFTMKSVMSGRSTGCSGACGPVMTDERRMTWFGHDRRTASSGAGSVVD